MRTRLPLIVMALALFANVGMAAALTPSCKTLSAGFLQSLKDGDFATATTHFGARMKAAISPDKIAQIWQQALPAQFGAFKEAVAPKVVHKGGNTVVVTPLHFANGWLNMLVACNDKEQISGLFFRPGQAPASSQSQAPASATAWITAAAVGAKTLPITVERNGFVLKGVLDLPAGKGPFAVVDVIPGSGPVDINGNAGPLQSSLYKRLAAAFVKAGWAVARVAKRYMLPSTGNASHYDFSDQVADNLAIVEALRHNPHINANRIVVAGHSIGGLIAPKLATETKLAGLILLEAPGESMTKITTTQVLEMNPSASTAQRAVIVKKQEAFYTKVSRTPSGDPLHYAGQQFPASKVQLLKSWYAQKPLAIARKVQIPVLVVQGGLDFNTPPGNGKRLVKALPHAKLLYLPKMGHALNIAHCRCPKQLHLGKGTKLAPGLTDGIISWLSALNQAALSPRNSD